MVATYINHGFSTKNLMTPWFVSVKLFTFESGAEEGHYFTRKLSRSPETELGHAIRTQFNCLLSHSSSVVMSRVSVMMTVCVERVSLISPWQCISSWLCSPHYCDHTPPPHHTTLPCSASLILSHWRHSSFMSNFFIVNKNLYFTAIINYLSCKMPLR